MQKNGLFLKTFLISTGINNIIGLERKKINSYLINYIISKIKQ